MNKKRIAIVTNHSLNFFAGSELVALDTVKILAEIGWRVYVGCFESSKVVRDLFDVYGVTWIDLKDSSLHLSEEVELLWGHHFTTFDRLLIDYGLVPRRVVYSSLSPFEQLEAPPLYHHWLSSISANSHETKERLLQLGVDSGKIFLFENCVPDHLFKTGGGRLYNRLQRVAVISNHVPSELSQAILLLKDRGVHVDIFGFSHRSVLVTPELLQGYDLVVTIGRTVQQCFALEVPVYCYDRFGGPGYVNADNFDLSAEFNFSGRCCRRVMTAQALCAEILSSYKQAIVNLGYLKDVAQARFRLSVATDELLNFIDLREYYGIPEDFQRLLFQHLRYQERASSMRHRVGHSGVADSTSPEKSQSLHAVVRAIAFHLPQFHTIAENDRWWGEGFTEWTNVRQGKPLFECHNQPREPGELGYYDLSNPQILERQASLARQYGLEGFCFYYYWFDGQRLLEKPVDQLLRHPEIDLPFCLCWANENWTRRWDGGEQEVLMKQSYSSELNERFALDLLPYMRDPRYIRIDGKPVFLVYRSDIIPDLPATLAAWRDVWRANGVGEVYLVGVESFRFFSPQESGFDATCEFLPHQVNIHLIGPDEPINLLSDPAANVGDYGKLAEHWVSRPRAPYKRFRGLVPAWDNASRRRKGGATLFVNSSPERYRQWLERTVAKTLVEFQGPERIIFINAWNEWGEGCYLEPDMRHGRAYLEATRDVLVRSEDALLKTLPLAERMGNQGYQQWIDRNRLSPSQQVQLVAHIQDGKRPLVVVVRADGAASVEALRITLDSLQSQQSRPDEVWVVGTQVPGEIHSSLMLRSFPQVDWTGVINAQAAEFDGWLLVMHAGDQLVEHGCLLLQDFLGEQDGLHACYFDEDWRLPDGGSAKPVFKPDFNLDMLRSFPYTGHSLLMHSTALRELGGLEARCADLAVHDFLFRVVEQFGMAAVGHLAEVLLHTGRPLEGWLASAPVAELVAQVSGSHLYRLGVAHQIRQGHLPGFNRIQYLAPQKPLVSIIVPTKDQSPMLQRCLESIIERTAYPHYELLVVDNASEAADAVAYLRGLQSLGSEQIRVLSYPHPFNYAAINNFAASHARGEYLLLLNNDTAALHDDWLDILVALAQRPEVGLVGPKLLYPDGTVQHAGVVLGLRGPAEHPFLGQERDAPGYMHRLQVEQNYSALTAACLMIPAVLYRELGGMDDENFKVSYNDVDLCLKVREAGYLAVWTPHACLLHEGSVSQRQTDRATQEAKRARFVGEQDAFYTRWIGAVGSDPAYNKNLSLNGVGFEIEDDTGLTWRPVHWRTAPLVLAHPADHAGCGHYRVIQPFNAMLKAGTADGMLSDGLLSVADLQRYSPDVIVLQRQVGEERLEAMRRMQAFSSAFKVYELDDYLPNLPIKSIHRAQMSKDILKVIKRGCSFVDRFVVSTEALADAFSQIHSDIRVVHNCLPVEWWSNLSGERRRGKKPRVGWAGGVSHSGDLELIVDVVRELADEVEWVFMGMCPDKIRPYVTEYYAGVAIERYPDRLAALDLDLALAPLEQNLFNECKSNLRLLEYGACGFPVVCSDVRCYRGELPVTRVKNRYKDWVAAIRMHISDLDASAKMGDELRKKVQEGWMLEGESLEVWRAAWLPD